MKECSQFHAPGPVLLAAGGRGLGKGRVWGLAQQKMSRISTFSLREHSQQGPWAELPPGIPLEVRREDSGEREKRLLKAQTSGLAGLRDEGRGLPVTVCPGLGFRAGSGVRDSGHSRAVILASW